MGKIILILSCMFAGKTETLITYARKYLLSKKKVVLIKYLRDTRYGSEICSHNGNKVSATFECENLNSIKNTEEVKNADVVLIDEVQFFKDSPEVCDEFANDGKIVVLAGLNGTYKRGEFPVISKLIPLCEEFITLSAVCSRCGEDAHFTKRLVENESIELIGGTESYEPRCRNCF